MFCSDLKSAIALHLHVPKQKLLEIVFVSNCIIFLYFLYLLLGITTRQFKRHRNPFAVFQQILGTFIQ